MKNFVNNTSKNNGPYKLVTRWFSLRFALKGFVLGIILTFIKVFIYDLDSLWLLVPILMMWFGIIYSFVIDFGGRNKK